MDNNPVCRQTVTVDLENGLHLVPCSRIAQVANRFASDVQVCKDGIRVDAKTILELMTLNAEFGTTLVLEATGNDADEAVRRLVELFETRFEDEVADKT